MTHSAHVWLVRRRWLGGRLAADSVETLQALARAGYIRSRDHVSAPNDTEELDEPLKWQEAWCIPELAISFRLAPAFFSPRRRRLLTYLFSTVVGLLMAAAVAVVLTETSGETRPIVAASVLLAICILHGVRRVELSVMRGRYEGALQQSFVVHRMKDNREPSRDELLLEFADWNHQLDTRHTLYEIHTVIEFLIVLVAFVNVF